jgi:hypothetical protein
MAGYIPIRQKTRDNIKSLLLGVTNANSNVFTNRAEPLMEEETSAVNIYTRDGSPEQTKQFEHEFKRTLQIFIEVLVRKTDIITKPEDESEIITGQIEDRLLPNHSLQYPPPENLQSASPTVTPGDEICDEIFVGNTTEGKTPEGLTDVASLITEYNIRYTYEVQTGAVVSLNTADIRYNLEGTQALADQAHDRIINLQCP